MRKPGKGKAQAGRKPKATPAQAAAIKAFREGMGWSQAKLAKMLGLTTPNAVYAWEGRAYGISKDTFIGLANLAMIGLPNSANASGYVKDFLSWAGVGAEAMDYIADMVDAARSRSTHSNVAVRSFSGDEEIEFPAWMVRNRATTRFVKLRTEYASQVFRPGGIVLIDTLITHVRELEGLVVAAVSAAGDPMFGIMGKEDLTIDEPLVRFKLWRFDGGGADIPISEFVGDPLTEHRQFRKLLGRVIAWIPDDQTSIEGEQQK